MFDQHGPSSALVPEKLRRIELHETIAQGKFGAVRKAINLDKKEVVAVKIMSMQVCTEKRHRFILSNGTYQILCIVGEAIVVN